MGLLYDFYVGDTQRIADAVARGEFDALRDAAIVAAHADLSFHIGPEDLDDLVLAACSATGRPPMTFDGCVLGDDAVDAGSGVHQMSEAFRDLFAALPLDRVGPLCEEWIGPMTEPPEPPDAARERPGAIRRGLERGVLGVVLLPVLACAWLFSPSFRRDRKAAKAKLAERASEPVVAEAPAAPTGPTIQQAVEDLVRCCSLAKERGLPVVYSWSL